MTRGRILARLVVAAMTVAAFTPANACTVPVYQWALEQWEPDTYTLHVFHDGDLEPGLQRALDEIESLSSPDTDGPRANVRLNLVDVGEGDPPGPVAALWAEQEGATLPWAVMTFPETKPPYGPVWSGPANADTMDMALRSPVREAIVQEYDSGATAVWVLLDGPDDEANAAAENLLREVTGRVVEAVAAAPVDEEDEEETESGAPQIDPDQVRTFSFPVMRARRTDSAETVLVNMLLASEPDLVQYDTPIAFAVYGRGRVLYALVDKGINAATVEDTCRFLSGACSCIVKDDNPGMDLLMTADWHSVIDWQVAAKGSEPPQTPPPLPPDALPPEPASPLPYIVAALVLLFASLTVVTLALRRRPRD